MIGQFTEQELMKLMKKSQFLKLMKKSQFISIREIQTKPSISFKHLTNV